MRKISTLVLSVLFLSGIATFVHSNPQDGDNAKTETENKVKMENASQLVICTGVEEREPVDEIISTDSSVGKVYCWSKVKVENFPQTVRHQWFVNGERVADVPLNINGSPWRTWTSKNIWAGKWKVELVDENGNVLKTKTFEVTE